MSNFRQTLKTQRWDDHRYYHHSLINQSLHFVSAFTFVLSYVLCYWDPAMAALIGWMISMTSRQAGHFFFEPKGYDEINQATHEYKEEIKVGYNLRRKVVLMTAWAACPLVLYLDPTLFGLLPQHYGVQEFIRRIGQIWLALGIIGLLFRTVQLCFTRDVETGLVWASKILTDPFHDMKLYYKAPIRLLRRGLRDYIDLDEEMAFDHQHGA